MRDAGAVLGRYEIRRVHLPPVLAVFQRRIPRVVIKGWFVLDSNNIGPLSFVLIYGDTADFAETFFRKDKPFTVLFGSDIRNVSSNCERDITGKRPWRRRPCEEISIRRAGCVFPDFLL